MRPRLFLISILTACLALAALAHASHPPVEHLLAAKLSRTATQLLQRGQLTVDTLRAAVILLREAAELAPDDPETWRHLLEAATLAEDREIIERAVDRLVELDPNDDRALLRQITLKLERYQTIEERITAYERMIQPENRRRLGPAISSRLAMDLALLERRRGNSEQFARWLAESVSLDRSNYRAASLAAGYFRLHVDDPVATTELLITLVKSDPSSLESLVLLANHLLEHGAYEGADRMYTLAMGGHEVTRQMPSSDLVADQAIARWGRGDRTEALRAISTYQVRRNEVYRARLRVEEPELTPMERAAREAPISITLASVEAALRLRQDDPNLAASLRRLVRTYEREIESLKASEGHDSAPNETGSLYLELAWMLMWLEGDQDRAKAFLDEARSRIELSERADARFRGWRAISEGRFEEAHSILEPFRDDDPTARLGLAQVFIAQGDRRQAARELLNLARAQPGTLLGVWAADHLFELLGQRVALTSEVAEMEQLVREISHAFDRYLTHPSSAITVRVLPVRETLKPYQPVTIRIEISNNSTIPMSIDRVGPIKPEVALVPSIQLSGQTRYRAATPVIVSIDRRLRLEPRERLIVSVDLQRTPLGAVLGLHPSTGSMVRARVVSNFMISGRGAILPGALGGEHEIPPFRIDGIRLTTPWVEELLGRLLSDPSREDVVDMALLAFSIAGDLPPDAPEIQQRMLAEARQTLFDAVEALDEVALAWFLLATPVTRSLEPMQELAQRSRSRFVQIAYLLERSSGADDPVVEAAIRGDDPALRELATILTRAVDRFRMDPEQFLEPDPGMGPGLPRR